MKVAIVGATGTLGSKLLERYPNAIAISRDELKQQQMKKQFPDAQWKIADIRDYQRLVECFRGCAYVFHVAALKHVDVVEQNPIEAYKTNIEGTVNVARACIANRVHYCAFSSTDKAVLPINSYGHTKALCERYLQSCNQEATSTKFSIFRWGNVFGSRGSAVLSFAESLRQSGIAYLTDKRMTRFWIHIDDAVDFMIANLQQWEDVNIPPMKGAKVTEVIEVLADYLRVGAYRLTPIGMRPGEKIHECIDVSNGRMITSDKAPQYTQRELLELTKRVFA